MLVFYPFIHYVYTTHSYYVHLCRTQCCFLVLSELILIHSSLTQTRKYGEHWRAPTSRPMSPLLPSNSTTPYQRVEKTLGVYAMYVHRIYTE